jgi:3-oxoacyl-[acyl-carrier protein] reductase
MKTLEGRVAVITGAATGVGRGIAGVLAQERATVIIADVNEAAAREAAANLDREGCEAFAIQVDVSVRESVRTMIASVLERFDRVDILAANAGVYPAVSLVDMTENDWDRVMDINAKGTFHTIQACLGSMRAQQYGRIILTSSITGPIVGAPGFAHYAASKAAMVGMMRSAALEVVSAGITINAVLPGNVRTSGFEQMGEKWRREIIDSIPLGRLAEPEDIGWCVRFFASEEAGYITGQTLVADGGQVLPEGSAT